MSPWHPDWIDDAALLVTDELHGDAGQTVPRYELTPLTMLWPPVTTLMSDVSWAQEPKGPAVRVSSPRLRPRRTDDRGGSRRAARRQTAETARSARARGRRRRCGPSRARRGRRPSRRRRTAGLRQCASAKSTGEDDSDGSAHGVGSASVGEREVAGAVRERGARGRLRPRAVCRPAAHQVRGVAFRAMQPLADAQQGLSAVGLRTASRAKVGQRRQLNRARPDSAR